MRPCSSCHSEQTEPLDMGLVRRLVSAIGGEPTLRAWLCRTCRHVDLWVDEPAAEGEAVAEATGDEEDAPAAPAPLPA
jgi:hypothetical protein